MAASSAWLAPWRSSGWTLVVALLVSCSASSRTGTADNPVVKTIELLTRLQASVIQSGESEQAAYKEYYEWCELASEDKKHEIHEEKREEVRLGAELQVAGNDVKEADSKIQDLSEMMASTAQKQKSASEVRESEKEAFGESESKLEKTIELLDQAIHILQQQTEASTSFMQSKGHARQLNSVFVGLGAVIEAAGLPAQDKPELVSLLQGGGEILDAPYGAEDKKAYISQGGGLIKAMEDMRGIAEAHLRECRDAESKAQHNYDLLRHQLDEEATDATKEMQLQNSNKAQRLQDKANLEGDLAVATRQVNDLTSAYKNMQEACMAQAADHEQSLRTRADELKALTEAKSTIQASMSGAESRMYSFLQTDMASGASTTSPVYLVSRQIVGMLKRLARQERSPELVQVASRIAALSRYGVAAGEDPLRKVRVLIKDLIVRLERESDDRVVFCKQVNKTKEKMDELEDSTEGIKSKLEQAAAASVGLKGEVKELQHELADLAQRQLELDRARQSEHEVYVEARADLQKGLAGIRTAMRLLRDYYSADEERADAALLQDHDSAVPTEPLPPEVHQKSTSAGAGIIGLLEVVESDIAKHLAQVESDEDDQQSDYDKETHESRVIKASKEKDVEYKVRRYKGIDKGVAELSSDHDDALDELTAVKEYYQKVKEQCEQGSYYLDRQARRKAEIKGLQEALAVLEGQEALLQRQRRPRALRHR